VERTPLFDIYQERSRFLVVLASVSRVVLTYFSQMTLWQTKSLLFCVYLVIRDLFSGDKVYKRYGPTWITYGRLTVLG